MKHIVETYALALLDVAIEQKSCEAFLQQLKTVETLIDDPLIFDFLSAPIVSYDKKGKVIQTFETYVSKPVVNFVKILVKNHRFKYFSMITRGYQELMFEHLNVLVVQASVPFEMSATQQEQLSQALAHKYQSRIHLEVMIDPSLIRGIKLTVKDQVIDASIKYQIQQLSQQLKKEDPYVA